MWISLNGEQIATAEAALPLTSEAVRYGRGAFETMLGIKGHGAFLLNDHIDRLFRSAERLGIPLAANEKEAALWINEALEGLGEETARLNFLAFEARFYCMAQPVDPVPKAGIRLFPFRLNRNLPDIKTTSYLPTLLAYEEATKAGFDDALLINRKNYATETSRANLFWVKENQLFTTGDDVLPSVLRAKIMENFPVQTEFINLPHLSNAKEVFTVSSYRGIRSVGEIGGQKFTAGPYTEKVATWLEENRKELCSKDYL